MRKSKCQGLGELSGRDVIQDRKFIFCNVHKYLKGCRTREKLSNCTALILTTPQKKNLRRAIKNKTDSYKFLNIQK